MNTEYFAQRIQCTRDDKEDCLYTVRQLLELAFEARQNGILALEGMIADQIRYPDPFLRKAVGLTLEIANPDKIRKVLCNLIVSTKNTGNHHFLKNVLITEAMLAISGREDLDYLFAHLLPSYFGIDYAPRVEELYRNYKKSLVKKTTLPAGLLSGKKL